MLDLVNSLHSTGVHVDIDLPVIAVIGSQSAGKSSLIESISGITLPRASGTCTRCPTECRLSHSPEPWKCTVSLRFIVDEHGHPLGQARNECFGEPIFEKVEVEERIRRAQRAILHPSTSSRQFLLGEDKDPADRELTFSTNCVSLQISGNDVADLSFRDLPGLIASVGTGGSSGDIDLVKKLVTSYIEKPSCIILLTVACETDFENQGAHHLAKTFDPEGKRTIGVLTKPDRIPEGTSTTGITWEEARQDERDYFSSTSPWSGLDFEFQDHLGTANLTERLSMVLSDLISKRLPEIQTELQNQLQTTEDHLRRLPMPPSTDALGEVLQLLGTFSRIVARFIEGTPEEDGLLQSIRPDHEVFKKAIRATAPHFKPSERDKTTDQFEAPGFISNEEAHLIPEDNEQAIYIDDVMDRARKAITRELPDNYPFVVTQQFIVEIIHKWETPAKKLFEAVHNTLVHRVKRLIRTHFAQYPQLQSNVTAIVTDFITSSSQSTLSYIGWLLNLEKRPRTLNEHYYADYREKFLAYYKGCRAQSNDAPLIGMLHSSRVSGNDVVTRIMTGLTELGMHDVQPSDLPKLLPADPYDAAIEIMAGVRAYYQVAYKRFVDNIPMAIDHELILSMDRDQALEKALRMGLGIGGADGSLRCAEYLQEPPTIANRREELQKKKARLHTAKKQLLELWL
ncbi:Interferon-induced GTP-binding protein Mx [Grifola frondosa]|uniref:Interferon-induced GTP-binding protein Mx n=1 Tax=Grifola frondosa TaxID=5627 RepID=A0A1C7LSP1_GRIFR|nr:Interferon-induced GTP-binding protein Mx [Grifola frondosa]